MEGSHSTIKSIKFWFKRTMHLHLLHVSNYCGQNRVHRNFTIYIHPFSYHLHIPAPSSGSMLYRYGNATRVIGKPANLQACRIFLRSRNAKLDYIRSLTQTSIIIAVLQHGSSSCLNITQSAELCRTKQFIFPKKIGNIREREKERDWAKRVKKIII
jgi:hypothetical protein